MSVVEDGRRLVLYAGGGPDNSAQCSPVHVRTDSSVYSVIYSKSYLMSPPILHIRERIWRSRSERSVPNSISTPLVYIVVVALWQLHTLIYHYNKKIPYLKQKTEVQGGA